MKKIVVIGGSNTDICGAPAARLVVNDSNPGTVTVRLGGVGRNIAHDLCLLGAEVTFITAVGGDSFGQNIFNSCKELGMDISMSIMVPEARSSTYLYVKDETGDMHLGISDMDVIENITPEYLSGYIERINKADAVVIDANLRQDSICYIAENTSLPMFADAVSTAKAGKLIPVLKDLKAIKPNRYEAEKMTGETDPEKAAMTLAAMGVGTAYVSMGEKGMVAASKEKCERYVPELVETVNATGAGDASMSAIVYATLLGKDLKDCMRAGALAGAITAADEETNSSKLSAENIGLI